MSEFIAKALAGKRNRTREGNTLRRDLAPLCSCSGIDIIHTCTLLGSSPDRNLFRLPGRSVSAPAALPAGPKAARPAASQAPSALLKVPPRPVVLSSGWQLQDAAKVPAER